MADKIQRVVYRIVVDTSQLAAGVAAARTELAALNKDDKKFGDDALKRAEALEKAKGKVAKAQRDLNDAIKAQPGGGGGQQGVGPTPSSSAPAHNYHPQLATIIAELKKIAAGSNNSGPNPNPNPNAPQGQQQQGSAKQPTALQQQKLDHNAVIQQEKLAQLQDDNATQQLVNEEKLEQAAQRTAEATNRAVTAQQRLETETHRTTAAQERQASQAIINAEREAQARSNALQAASRQATADLENEARLDRIADQDAISANRVAQSSENAAAAHERYNGVLQRNADAASVAAARITELDARTNRASEQARLNADRATEVRERASRNEQLHEYQLEQARQRALAATARATAAENALTAARARPRTINDRIQRARDRFAEVSERNAAFQRGVSERATARREEVGVDYDDRLRDLIARTRHTVPGFTPVRTPREDGQTLEEYTAARRRDLEAERDQIVSAHAQRRARIGLNAETRNAVRLLREHREESFRSSRRTDDEGRPRVGGARGLITSIGRGLRQAQQEGAELVDHIGDSATRRLSRWQLMLRLIGAALILLIPLVASLTAVLGTMVATLVAAGTAVAVFAIAGVAQFKALTEAIKEADRTGAALPQRFQAVGNAFFALRDAFKEFGSATQGPVLAVFAQALQVAAGILPKIVDTVSAAAEGLRRGLGIIDASIQGGRFSDFLNFVDRQAPGAIAGLIQGLKDLAAGVAEMAMSFEPFIQWFIDGFTNMGASFRDWARNLATSEEFNRFMAYAMEVGPLVVDTLYDLLRIIINLGAAFAPVAEWGYQLIRAFAALLEAIPLAALQAFIMALTAFGILKVVILLVGGFKVALLGVRSMLLVVEAALTRTAVAMGATARAAVIARGAMLALGAVTAVLIAVAVAMSAVSAAEDKAAAAAERHRTTVRNLADDLRENGGVASEGYRKQVLEELNANINPYNAMDDWEWYTDKRSSKYQRTTSVTAEAKAAGIDLGRLVSGASGNEEARNETIAKFEERIAELDARAKKSDDPREKAKLDAQAAQAERALEQYRQQSASRVELTKVEEEYQRAVAGSTKAMTAQEIAAARLEKKLAQLTEQTKEQERVQAALEARQQYLDLVEQTSDAERNLNRIYVDMQDNNLRAAQAVIRAENALTDAQKAATRAAENLTRARERAQEKLMEYRDTLRDIPLDEEAADIAMERAAENLRRTLNDSSATDLDRREARLQYERAKNSRTDTYEDNQLRKIEAERGLAKGVEGSDEVLEAINAERDARLALKDAEYALVDARKAQQRALEDGQEAFDDAQREVIELRDRTLEARNNMDTLAAAAHTTAGNLGTMKDRHKELREELDRALSTKGLDDYEGRLAVLLEFQRALQILDANPNMTVMDAMRQASTEAQDAAEAAAHGWASGGEVAGPGGSTTDSVPAWLSAGEHVWTAAETIAVGGHRAMEALRAAVKRGQFTEAHVARFLGGVRRQFASGGEVAGDVLAQAGIPTAAFDPSAMYSALNDVTRGVRAPGASLTVVPGGGSSSSTVNNRGLHVEQIVVNNPVREPSGESMYRAVRRLAFEYEG